MREVKIKPAAGKAAKPLEVAPIDCDVHIAVPSMQALVPYLDDYWQEAVRTRGLDRHLMNVTGNAVNAPIFARPDWRPKSGAPGTDLEALRTQLLDPFGTKFAICNCVYGAQVLHNEDMAAALCRAVNDWIVREWLDREPRLRASIVVPVQNPQLSVEEIERCAGDKRFVQVLLPPRTVEPFGRRRYRPIFEAAVRNKLPVGLHLGGVGGHPSTGSGYPSYYIEEHTSQVQTMQALVTSLVVEGVFEEFPSLQIVLIEGGFSWVPSLSWRLDKHWKKFKSEVPHLKRAPLEQVREHFRYTTQPIEEPENPRHLRDIIDWVGVERLMFSTDYPHWDFDDPRQALNNAGLSEAEKKKVFSGNAKAFYGLS